MAISAVTRENVQPLLYKVQELLDSLPPEIVDISDELPEITPAADENAFQVHTPDEGHFLVTGVGIERIVQMTNWDYYESSLRFQRILRAMGIRSKLEEMGVAEGDTVQIGEMELVWGYENALDV